MSDVLERLEPAIKAVYVEAATDRRLSGYRVVGEALTAATDAAAEIRKMREENARLREALESIGCCANGCREQIEDALSDNEAGQECNVVEYDGAYRCTTHGKQWGALPADSITGPCQPAPQPDGWVSVEDRLPECDTYVLICGPGLASVIIGYLYGDKWFDENGEWTTGVTHWRPLPAPPESEGE